MRQENTDRHELIESSSDDQRSHQEKHLKKTKTSCEKTETDKIDSIPDNQPSTSRQSQRLKKKPNRYGQIIMVSKVEEEEKGMEEAAPRETKSEEIGKELEAIPNFLEVTQEEINDWINN